MINNKYRISIFIFIPFVLSSFINFLPIHFVFYFSFFKKNFCHFSKILKTKINKTIFFQCFSFPFFAFLLCHVINNFFNIICAVRIISFWITNFREFWLIIRVYCYTKYDSVYHTDEPSSAHLTMKFIYSSLNVLRLALDQDLFNCSVSGRRSVAIVSKLLNSISSVWRAWKET